MPAKQQHCVLEGNKRENKKKITRNKNKTIVDGYSEIY